MSAYHRAVYCINSSVLIDVRRQSKIDVQKQPKHSYNNNGYNSAPLGSNDAWGNNNNQYQPMDAYTATGAGGTVSVNNF